MFSHLLDRLRDERGSVTLETAILALPMIALLVLVGAAMQFGGAQQSVTGAAAAAAREASYASTTRDANIAAQSMADLSLRNSSTNCVSTDVTVDATGVEVALGTTGQVTVTVRCTVTYSDAALVGLPGTTTLVATSTAPVDAYRERG